MNIIQKVKSSPNKPMHNNYQEVTVDAAGKGPVVDFSGVYTRNSGLAGLSPIKQTGSITHNANEENAKAPKKSWLDWTQDALDIGGFIPGVGVVLDLANAGISVARGDYGRAAMSAFAAVPGLDYAAAGAKGLSKLQKAKKLIPSANPLSAIRNRPKTSIAEGLVGIDYANSNLNPLADQMGLQGDRTSYTEKVVTPIVTPVIEKGMEAYNSESGQKIRSGVSDVYEGIKGGISSLFSDDDNKKDDDKPNNQDQPNPDPQPDKPKPKNYDRTGASSSEKLRKIQEARGYFRDK